MTTRRRSRSTTLLLVCALVVTMIGVPGTPAPAVGTCVTPPDIVPVGDLSPGDMGTGWTAVQGQTPEAFDVEILGVLPDGIAPGIDFVLIEVSGPVVEEFGGIASGMSGSPVYIEGDLVGAISYGFFASDHMIGGLTPAEDMLSLLNYPDATEIPFSATVDLPQELQQAAERASGDGRELATAQQLQIPLAVSGLSPHGMELLERRLAKQRLPFDPQRSGSAPSPSGPVTGSQPQPGEPVASMLSYGDVSAGGIGTQTLTCGNLSVAFGHPMGWFGRTTMGMNEASIIKVISDPSHLYGPFKMGVVGDTAGTIDQDRNAGIRGIEGAAPPTTPVTTELHNAELGTTKDGQTDVVTPLLMPDLAGFHLAQAIWDSLDTWWAGTVHLSWTIEGTREDDTPFTVNYSNAIYDDYDVGFVSYIYLWGQLYRLQENDIEQVTITSIDVTGEVDQDRLTSRVMSVRSRTDKQPDLEKRKTIKVAAGKKVTLAVDLNPWAPGPNRLETFEMKVPKRYAGDTMAIVVGGGGQVLGPDGGYSYYGYYYGGSEPETFDELIAQLEGSHPNDDLVVQLIGTDGQEASADPSVSSHGGYDYDGPNIVKELVAHQPDVVRGVSDLRLRVMGR